MKIDFSAKLVNLEGKALKSEEDKPLTLSLISVNALLASLDDDKADGAEKLKRYDLALKIKEGGVKEISVEEVAKIKEMVGKVYATLIVGQVYKLIEG